MAITTTQPKLHWNYFLALERDMELLSRYVEFCRPNYAVFSIEIAHLLFAAASEVDAVAKLLCEQLNPAAQRNNINDYKATLLPALPDLPTTEVSLPRYGLALKPWSNWVSGQAPDWWRSYNKVKHERDTYFEQATLKNALNALGALLIITFHYYSRKLALQQGQCLSAKDTMSELNPESTLYRLPETFYYSRVVV